MSYAYRPEPPSPEVVRERGSGPGRLGGRPGTTRPPGWFPDVCVLSTWFGFACERVVPAGEGPTRDHTFVGMSLVAAGVRRTG